MIILGTILVMAVVAWNFLGIVSAIYEGAKQLQPEIYVPLAITVSTAVIGLSATLFTQVSNRKREIDAALRERKIEIYLQFLKTIEKVIMAQKPELGSEPIDQLALTKELIDIRTKAVLWGSPNVLRAISKLGKPDQSGPLQTFRVIEDIQRSMRRDLGLSNFGLPTLFFIKMLLNDPEELDRLQQK